MQSAAEPKYPGEEILALARENNVRAREMLFGAMDDLFRQRIGVLSEKEYFLVTEILKSLVGQFEVEVRRALSEQLAHRDDVPEELIAELANDEASVAFPVLARSRVLSDEALIEVILNRTRDHQLAVALRPYVSERVSDALIRTGVPDVIQTLLENPNSKISLATQTFLVEKAKRFDAFRLPLLLRHDLSAGLHNKLLNFVSAALRDYICKRYRVPVIVIDEEVAAAARSTASKCGTKMSESGAELTKRLAQFKQITPELVLETLRSGEVELFVLLTAELSGLRFRLVQRFLHEPSFAGMTVVFRGLDFSRECFSSIFLLVRSARYDSRAVSPDDWEKGLAYFDCLSVENAREALAWWRLEEGYLRALRTLQET